MQDPKDPEENPQKNTQRKVKNIKKGKSSFTQSLMQSFIAAKSKLLKYFGGKAVSLPNYKQDQKYYHYWITRKCYVLVNQPWFQNSIAACILLNTITLALDAYPP